MSFFQNRLWFYDIYLSNISKNKISKFSNELIIITITINNSNRQKVMGIKYTQHKDISWSKRYRGKVALIHTKKIIWNRSFIEMDDINPKILKGPPKK